MIDTQTDWLTRQVSNWASQKLQTVLMVSPSGLSLSYSQYQSSDLLILTFFDSSSWISWLLTNTALDPWLTRNNLRITEGVWKSYWALTGSIGWAGFRWRFQAVAALPVGYWDIDLRLLFQLQLQLQLHYSDSDWLILTCADSYCIQLRFRFIMTVKIPY